MYKSGVKKNQTKTPTNSKEYKECNIESILNHIQCESKFKVENESLKCE